MNTGGTAFPLPNRYAAEGMTLLDWYAGQALTSRGLYGANVRENEVAKECYTIAAAMLAEKARRQAVGQQSSTTDHSEDSLEKVVKLEAANSELVEALERIQFVLPPGWDEIPSMASAIARARAILAKHKGVA